MTASADRYRCAILQTSTVTLRRTASPRDVGNGPVRVVGRQRVQVFSRHISSRKTRFPAQTTRSIDCFRCPAPARNIAGICRQAPTSSQPVRRRQPTCTRCRPTTRTGVVRTRFSAKNGFSDRNYPVNGLFPLSGNGEQYYKQLSSLWRVQLARETSPTDLYALSDDNAYRCLRDTFRRGRRVFLPKADG